MKRSPHGDGITEVTDITGRGTFVTTGKKTGTAGHLDIHDILEPDVSSLTHNLGAIISQPTPPLSASLASSSRKLVTRVSPRIPPRSTSLATYHIGRTQNQVLGHRLKLAKRKDTPVLNISRRGSHSLAMDAARPENRAAALAELRADQFAPSGRGPRRAR